MSAFRSASPSSIVLLFGSGRCGSTLAQELLSLHPALAWLPDRLCRRAPTRHGLVHAFQLALDAPLLGRCLRAVAAPGEEYGFWEHLAPGFAAPNRDLVAADVTPEVRERLTRAFTRVATRRRPRVLVKITGWPRVGYLREVFPAAPLVHVVRDPRDVAQSLLDAGWWRAESDSLAGAGEDGELRARHGDSAFTAACLHVRAYWRAWESARRSLPAPPPIELRYDELCARPLETLVRVASACRLQRVPAFERALAGLSLPQRGGRWRKRWTASERKAAEELLAPCRAVFESRSR